MDTAGPGMLGTRAETNIHIKGVQKKIRSFALWRLTPLNLMRFSSYAHQIKAVFPTILTIIITFF